MTRLILQLAIFSLIVGRILAGATNDAAGFAGFFRSHCAALAQEAETRGAMTVPGRDGWLFLAAELRHLGAGPFRGESAAKVSRAVKPEHADPLPAIVDFHAQLRNMGVELLIVPVPPKAVIYPNGLVTNVPCDPSGRQTRPDTVLQQFYDQLRRKDIRVLDLTDLFIANRAHPEGALYCRQDSHWSDVGCVMAAAEIGRELAGAFKDYPRQTWTGAWDTIEISGDLWQALGDPELPREQIRIRRVARAGQGVVAEPARDSPVILLGDSHGLVFHGGDDMLARDAGLADQLALELGFPVDLAAVRGSGATSARINLFRRAQKDPDYWAGKKWVIWCFSAREFTESDGWRKAPLKP